MENTNDIQRKKREELLQIPEEIQRPLILSDRKDPRTSALDFPAVPTTVLSRFRLSHKKKAIQKELFRFFVLGICTMFLLHFLGFYFQGLEVGTQLKVKAENGYKNFTTALSALKEQDFVAAGKQFSLAGKEFSFLSEEILSLAPPSGRNALTEHSPFVTAQALSSAGKHLALSGKILTNVATKAKDLPTLFLAQQKGTSEVSLPNTLHFMTTQTESALDHLTKARKKMQQLNALFLPQKIQEKIIKAMGEIQHAKELLAQGIEIMPLLLDLLGDRYPHSYLILLQNNTEIRATGGFIGSLLRIDMNDGVITKMEFEDVYLRDGQLTEHVPPPVGLAPITVGWGLRDANYSPDFPTSAQDVLWFWEKEKGQTIDTVIAITPDIVTEVLKHTGPITLENDIIFDAENIVSRLSFLTESKFAGKEDPKIFIQTMIPPLKEKILELPPKKIIQLLQEMVTQKSILAFSKKQSIQEFFETLQVVGNIQKTSDDYLMVVQSSYSGNKSDGNMKQKIWHKAEITPEGELIDTVTVVRKHLWGIDPKYEQQFLENVDKFGFGKIHPYTQQREIAGRGDNKVYTRLYVPKNSEIIEVSGIEKKDILITQKQGKTLFEYFFPTVIRGQQEQVSIRYKVPKNVQNNYQLFLQKQPGILNSSFHQITTFPEKEGVEKWGEQTTDERIVVSKE